MYREQRPNRLARFLNRVWAWIGSAGVAAERVVTLEVVGRRSGRVISLPLVPAYFGGQRYLVSMLGENVDWVRNARAAGGRVALRHGCREDVVLDEVPVEHRGPILKEYLRRAPGARPHLPVKKDAPLAEFDAVAPSIPVFLVLAAGPSRGAEPEPA
jgi:hypothetical protein